jgi:transcriptional regulator with XRE-family HTH domain
MGKKVEVEPKSLQAAIGMACRVARDAFGYSQQEVAVLVGVDEEFYGRIERGDSMPSMTTFSRLCAVLNVAPSVLLGHREFDERMRTPTSRKEVVRRRRLTRIERALRRDPRLLRPVRLLLEGLGEGERSSKKKGKKARRAKRSKMH